MSLAAYGTLLQSGVFWRVLQITLEIALTVTLCCLALAYPLALWLARLPQAAANFALILVLVPFWTSVLVRSYAWMALLERHGVVNNLLVWLGLLATPIKLLNTRFAVCLAMTHVLLPFMVLPIYASLRSLDWRLVRAAQSLGATPWGALRQVVLPLSRPGIGAGVTLVFTLGDRVLHHAGPGRRVVGRDDLRPDQRRGRPAGYGRRRARWRRYPAGARAAGHGRRWRG